MAGGWFFLMISESYQLGDVDFRLPGVGSYMSVAVDKGRVDAMVWALIAMLLMIVGLDQFLWRPVVVWAQKFRVEEGSSEVVATSWFLNLLRRSGTGAVCAPCRAVSAEAIAGGSPTPLVKEAVGATTNYWQWVTLVAFGALLLLLGFGAWRLFKLLSGVSRTRVADYADGSSRHAFTGACFDGARYAVGGAGRARDWIVAATVTDISADCASCRIVSRTNVVSNCRGNHGILAYLVRLGSDCTDAARHAVVHLV